MEGSKSSGAGSRLIIPGLLALLFMLALLPACSAQTGGDNKPLAKVDGKDVTEADLRANDAAAFKQFDRDYAQKRHDFLETQLHQTVQDRLLTLEAAAQKTSKDQLLASIKTPEVTDADVDKFYEEKKAMISRPKEQIAPQIKQYLAQQREAEARDKFFATLEAKYKVDYRLEPLRQPVQAAGFPAKGPSAAPITIVEFSDFQCPFCSRLNPTLEQAVNKYGDKIRIVFRQFPLPMHANAAKAAEAALCANEQGKFWEMHDAMFKDQAGLAVDALKTKAASLGMDAKAFGECLDNGKESGAVQTDIKAGTEVGVSGTPAMFINGRMLSGAVPIERLSEVIDDELKRGGKGTS